MIIQFQQWYKPTILQIWKEVYKTYPRITVLRIIRAKQAWELPIWTVEFEATQ